MSHEYIAALTLKNETATESRNTAGTANPCARSCLALPSSRSGAVRRPPLVAYHEIEVSSVSSSKTEPPIIDGLADHLSDHLSVEFQGSLSGRPSYVKSGIGIPRGFMGVPGGPMKPT